MSDFDVVEFGYNIADETINFGTRSLADNLHEAATLATLKCSEQNEIRANPHINAIVQRGCIYFNVDSSMKIFKDKQCSDVIFNAGFEAIVDTFCVSGSGEYLLICLRDGNVHLIDCNNEYNCVFTKFCERDDDGDRFFINSFLHADSFIIVTKLGQVYRCSFHQDFKVDLVHEFNFKIEISSFQYPFLLVNGTKLAIFDFENNNVAFDMPGAFKKIFPLNQMFFALDFSGKLFQICALTLLIVPINNQNLYQDIQVLSDSNQKQVIVVTEDESKQNFIQVLSYPDLEKLYSLKVGNEIHLISLESLNDELLYISKISPSELRFHMVYETDAEQRLQRLLKKQKYEEAERLAQLFHLDVALINKAKAQEIVDKTTCGTEDVENLINLLNVIEDDEFKLRCCLDVESLCNKLEDVRKILTYGCKLQSKKQDKSLVIEELQNSITHLMFKFDTFVTINRGGNQTIQSWAEFSGCNLIEEVILLLGNSQIEEAKIIYSRLDELTAEQLNESDVSNILSVLTNLPTSTYSPFLPPFVSITLSILPSTLPLFVKWTYNKVSKLEKREKSDFPNNAIKFTEKIVGLIKVDNLSHIFSLYRDSLVELSSLLSALKSLKLLKDEYRISIPVTGYLSGPHNVIRLLLNTKMCPEDYDVFLKKFLCKYMLENHMEPNKILLGEIAGLMKYEECSWVTIIGSILNCISSIRLKLEAVKNILEFAAVPWSDTIRKIANDSLKCCHPLTADIKELIENEPMQVVLRRQKYKIKDRQIAGVNDLKFILNRIIYCNEPTMVEDVYKLCKTPEYRHVANILLITHFIRKGCLEKALRVLDDNGPEEVLRCAAEVAAMIETVINDEIGLPTEMITNYYNISSSIFKRLNDLLTNAFDRTCAKQTLDLIRNVSDLRKHFDIKTTTHDLRVRSYRTKVVDGVIEEARRAFEAGTQSADEAFAVCRKLSASTGSDESEILMKFCEKSGDYNAIVKGAERVRDAEASPRSLCLMAVLLLKHVGTYKVQILDNSGSDCDESQILAESVDDDVFCKGLQLAQQLTAKAVAKARDGELMACMEVARWANASFYFTKNQNTELKRRLFGDSYDSASVLPGFLTFSTIKNVFNAFCGFSGSFKNPDAVYLTHFNNARLTEDELFKELRLLPPILENMSKEGQHFTSYKIVETLHTSLIQTPKPNPTILNFLNEVMKKMCIPKVLSWILSNTMTDDLLYNLLLSCDRDDSIKFIMTNLRMYKRHPAKFACILRTGLRCWEHHNVANGKEEMMNNLITMKWWKKFESKKFDYGNFFRSKPEDRFAFLVNSDCLDIDLLQMYCEDYKLPAKFLYKYFFKTIFLNWKPEYEIKTDGERKYVIVKSNEDDLLKKCLPVMEVIDSQHVSKIISNVWNSVNTYYYEVFIVMINILKMVDPQEDNSAKLDLLFFLKNYQRVSKPSETEIEQWYTNFPDTQAMDVLSEFRLSFTPLFFTTQIFHIIRPEINLKTYKFWFHAVEILKPYLNKNELCSFVVKDVVASGILSKDATDGWVLHPKHDDLLKEIDDCVKNITNLELTTSVVYHLVIHTPPGADQVNAAKLCYKYAKKYRHLNPGSSVVEKAVTKVEKKYFMYCAMHILYTHQLAEKKYMNLLTHPKDLITALYLDERILRKNEVNLHCPDIKKATEALAELFEVDIRRIRYDLINNWLDDNSSDVDFDSSLVYSREEGGGGNLNRIAYVCCADEVSYWQTHLLRLGLGSETEEQKSGHCKVNALKVFAMISDIDTIVQMTELTYDEFMNFIDKCTIVGDLQYLGIGLDVEGLSLYNKKELLHRLMQRAGNVLAIKTIALICMTYQIYDVKYWEFITNTSIKFSLFSELKTYVTFLKKAKFQFKSFYINAWQKLIDHSFAHLNNPEQLDEALLANFLMIQSCPVLYSLNFDSVFRRCLDKDKAEFAAVLLQYVGKDVRNKYLREIRNLNKNLLSSLNNLEQNGLWGIFYVKTILTQED